MPNYKAKTNQVRGKDGKWIKKTYQQTTVSNPLDELREVSHALRSLPPGNGGFPVDPVQSYVGVLNTVRRFYRNPDMAIQDNRADATKMLSDGSIYAPLQSRILATCTLPGQVEPENKKSPYQTAVASIIEEIIHEIKDFIKYKHWLSTGLWYGRSGIENRFEWDFSKGYKRMIVKDWVPVHGDSIEFKFDSDKVALAVGSYQAIGGVKPLNKDQIEVGDQTRAYVLSPRERLCLVLHTHLIQAGDFFTPQSAGLVKGTGLRHICYLTWKIKHEIMGWLIDFIERIGTGFTIFYYDVSNPASEAHVRGIAESQSFQNIIIWPRAAGEEKGTAGIERIEPNSAGIDNLMRVIDDFFGRQLALVIQGQELTSQSGSTGLGSNLATIHQDTFKSLIKFDAINLAETITRDLIYPLMLFNFPDAGFKCKYVINCDRPDPEKKLQAIRQFYDMGGSIDEDEVRGFLELSKPDADARVLKKSSGIAPDLNKYLDGTVDQV